MSAFFIYLLKVVVCSSLFAGCYWLFLRKERFYAWNRFFIMASVALSILIPVLIIPVGNASQLIPATNEIFSHFVINPNGSEMDELILSGRSPVSFQWIGLFVYFAVVILLLGKKLIYFSRILLTLYPNYYRDFISRFFQSPVKRRIFMITKNKTQKSSMNLLRKMSILPVTMCALYAFSIQPADMMASKSSLPESVMQQDPWTPQNELEELIVVVGYGQNVTPRKDIQVIRDSERTIAPGAISYTEVEQKPVFQEGKDGYFRFMASNIKYPVIAQENGIVGKIVVSYVIDTNGNVTDVKSPVKIDGLSMEGERLIKSMPAWKPGSHKGKNVAVQCFAIMEFKIRD